MRKQYGFRGNAFGMDNFTKIKELKVSPKLIQRKAGIYAAEKAKGQMNDFRASEDWLEKFMSRNGLSLRRRTTQAQNTPEQIIDKVIYRIFYMSAN